MKTRPWIPIALVLLVLLGATVAVGTLVRSRLSEAEAVLVPFMEPELADLSADEDLPSAPCQNSEDIADTIRDFYEAVDVDRGQAVDDDAALVEITTTDPTFDSFLLESAIARVTFGRHQILLRARSTNGDWCVDEVDFSTE